MLPAKSAFRCLRKLRASAACGGIARRCSQERLQSDYRTLSVATCNFSRLPKAFCQVVAFSTICMKRLSCTAPVCSTTVIFRSFTFAFIFPIPAFKQATIPTRISAMIYLLHQLQMLYIRSTIEHWARWIYSCPLPRGEGLFHYLRRIFVRYSTEVYSISRRGCDLRKGLLSSISWKAPT